MKQALSTLLFLVAFFPITVFSNSEEGRLLDRIVAIVNDEVILFSELNTRVLQAQRELQSRNVNIADTTELQRKVLDKMIMEKIQLKRIKDRGIKISDEELLSQIQDIAMENNLTVINLRDQLNMASPDGFKEFREQIRQQMMFRKLQQVEILSQTQVTEDEIDNYLQRQSLAENNLEYHLGHIMINLPESATPSDREAAQQQAQEILNKLIQGEDFSQVAVRYSQGSKALQGGDLGWLSWDQIPTFFAKSVRDLDIGQLSNLIRSPVGYHIIKLKDKRNKNSQLIEQYNLYRFIILSENAKQAEKPPAALVELAQNIKSMQDFKQLNERYSDIPASVNANGNLGWQTIQEMPLEYAQAIADLEPGHAAMPIATDEGWIILYLDAIRKEDINSANRRQQAMEALRMKKANETYEIWLRRLKEEALIDIRIPELKQTAES